MVAPLTPQEVERSPSGLPVFVVAAVNALLQEHYVNGTAKFTQDELIERAIAYAAGAGIKDVERHSFFERGWLNIERTFQAAGWSVEYDKPAYYETYPASFTFEAAK